MIFPNFLIIIKTIKDTPHVEKYIVALIDRSLNQTPLSLVGKPVWSHQSTSLRHCQWPIVDYTCPTLFCTRRSATNNLNRPFPRCASPKMDKRLIEGCFPTEDFSRCSSKSQECPLVILERWWISCPNPLQCQSEPRSRADTDWGILDRMEGRNPEAAIGLWFLEFLRPLRCRTIQLGEMGAAYPVMER